MVYATFGQILLNLVGPLMKVGVGILIIALIVGGGFTLPFLKIPWYVFAGLLFFLILFLTKR